MYYLVVHNDKPVRYTVVDGGFNQAVRLTGGENEIVKGDRFVTIDQGKIYEVISTLIIPGYSIALKDTRGFMSLTYVWQLLDSLKTCTHEYKLYEGFTESYQYCAKCDAKKL